MTAYVALLRAVNVGGTGKLPMTDLRSLCEDAGFIKVQTYIASGNVVFASRNSEKQIKALLESSLADYAGKKIDVFVRSAAVSHLWPQAIPSLKRRAAASWPSS
jgi:uncharacterized protein (DUF1697 family)